MDMRLKTNSGAEVVEMPEAWKRLEQLEKGVDSLGCLASELTSRLDRVRRGAVPTPQLAATARLQDSAPSNLSVNLANLTDRVAAIREQLREALDTLEV
jgi:hypothetical protein